MFKLTININSKLSIDIRYVYGIQNLIIKEESGQFTRNTALNVGLRYSFKFKEPQINEDLQSAVANLPATTTQYGRATKPAAYYFKSILNPKNPRIPCIGAKLYVGSKVNPFGLLTSMFLSNGSKGRSIGSPGI